MNLMRVLSPLSDDEKIEALEGLIYDYDKLEVIKEIVDDEKKIKALEKLVYDYTKSEVIAILADEDKRIELLGILGDDCSKAKVIATILSDDKKIELLDILNNDLAKVLAIATLQDDTKKTYETKKLSDEVARAFIYEISENSLNNMGRLKDILLKDSRLYPEIGIDPRMTIGMEIESEGEMSKVIINLVEIIKRQKNEEIRRWQIEEKNGNTARIAIFSRRTRCI